MSLSEAEKLNVSDNDIYFSVGIHPWDIPKLEKGWESRLEKICEHKAVIMVGECGFDKNTDVSFDAQKAVFDNHIRVSESFKMPLIIHCVGYYNELAVIKKQFNPEQKWIIHGFRGKPQLADQLIRNGFYLSFGERYNPESVKITALDRIFIETDESKKPIKEIYQEISELKGCEIESLLVSSSEIFNL
ncbi:MAG: hypothetical protein GX102_10635 [Porphyromonadaceae bacterium]|nr:hypothetical protein [Porphyromonadaceae bacterium]